ncbi:hypothetical protein Hanom_Chr03g00250011 [Helianthus anomalus]
MDNRRDFHTASRFWNTSYTGSQLFMRFMLAPTKTPRYLKGEASGLHPTSFAILLTSFQPTPTPKRLDLSILIFKPELMWKHQRTLSILFTSSKDHSPMIMASSAYSKSPP